MFANTKNVTFPEHMERIQNTKEEIIYHRENNAEERALIAFSMSENECMQKIQQFIAEMRLIISSDLDTSRLIAEIKQYTQKVKQELQKNIDLDVKQIIYMYRTAFNQGISRRECTNREKLILIMYIQKQIEILSESVS